VVSFLLAFPPKFYTHSSSPHACYMAYPSHHPSFHHSNCIWRRVQVMRLLIVQFSPTSYHFARNQLLFLFVIESEYKHKQRSQPLARNASAFSRCSDVVAGFFCIMVVFIYLNICLRFYSCVGKFKRCDLKSLDYRKVQIDRLALKLGIFITLHSFQACLSVSV
jgi:hypothetical protein